jgi:DNA-binding CsgD family transcriptional regulator
MEVAGTMRLALQRALIELEYAQERMGLDRSLARAATIESVKRALILAQSKHEIRLNRQRAGIARAHAEGKYRGRAPTARRQLAEMVKLRGEGLLPREIAQRLGVSRSSVYRLLEERSPDLGDDHGAA